MGKPPPYFLRLRIFAKLICYFYNKLQQLDPVYDNCPVRCLAPERDKKNGCPDCSYTIFFEKLKRDYYHLVSKDLEKLLEESGFSKEASKKEAQKLSKTDWTFEDIFTDYRTLCELEAQAGTETEERGGGYSLSWTIRAETGIAIVREERYKFRRELQYQRKQERLAEERARQRD